VILSTTPEIAGREARRLLESVRGCRGHIFNLGHGILPTATIECVEAVVGAVTGWK
jgi:uroporphyrinogen decarboxylase